MKGYTPMQIINELNIEKCQAHISLIERLKRTRVSASTTIPFGAVKFGNRSRATS